MYSPTAMVDQLFTLTSYFYPSFVDAFNPDYWKYPKFGKAKYLEVEQNSGELMIIPTGWFHQVGCGFYSGQTGTPILSFCLLFEIYINI